MKQRLKKVVFRRDVITRKFFKISLLLTDRQIFASRACLLLPHGAPLLLQNKTFIVVNNTDLKIGPQGDAIMKSN